MLRQQTSQHKSILPLLQLYFHNVPLSTVYQPITLCCRNRVVEVKSKKNVHSEADRAILAKNIDDFALFFAALTAYASTARVSQAQANDTLNQAPRS